METYYKVLGLLCSLTGLACLVAGAIDYWQGHVGEATYFVALACFLSIQSVKQT